MGLAVESAGRCFSHMVIYLFLAVGVCPTIIWWNKHLDNAAVRVDSNSCMMWVLIMPDEAYMAMDLFLLRKGENKGKKIGGGRECPIWTSSRIRTNFPPTPPSSWN